MVAKASGKTRRSKATFWGQMRRPDYVLNTTKIIRENILIAIDSQVFTHVLIWRSSSQPVLTVQIGTMTMGRFSSVRVAHFYGDSVPNIHDGQGWNLDRLLEWIHQLVISEVARHMNIGAHAYPEGLTPLQRKIYRAVLERGWLSRDEIAQSVERKKSSWLNHQIESLVKQGHLSRKEVLRYNGLPMFFYSVNL